MTEQLPIHISNLSPLPGGKSEPTFPEGARFPSTHFSRDKQAEFLEALALWGGVRAACRKAAVAPQTVYRHRRASRDFALGWDAALVVARPHVEEVLGDRALNGVEEVIYYHGEEIGRRRRYDSRLLLAHLARLDAVAGADDEVCEVAADFDAALDRLRRGAPVDGSAPAADEGVGDDEPWMDESLPFAERVLLYVETLPDDDAGEGTDQEDDDALPDPFGGPYEDADEDEDEQGSDEELAAGDYLLQDRVTPVTLQHEEDDPAPAEDARSGPDPEPAAMPAPEPVVPPYELLRPFDTLDAPRLFGNHGPIKDGRLQRMA